MTDTSIYVSWAIITSPNNDSALMRICSAKWMKQVHCITDENWWICLHHFLFGKYMYKFFYLRNKHLFYFVYSINYLIAIRNFNIHISESFYLTEITSFKSQFFCNKFFPSFLNILFNELYKSSLIFKFKKLLYEKNIFKKLQK